jgi:hypothetical protein
VEEEVARGCGLELLELSGIYERGVVRYEAGHRIDREVREHAAEEHDEALEVMEPEMRERYEAELVRMNEQLEGTKRSSAPPQ